MHRWQILTAGAVSLGLAVLIALALRTAQHTAGEDGRGPAAVDQGGMAQSSEAMEMAAPALDPQREAIEQAMEEVAEPEDDFEIVDEGIGGSQLDPGPGEPSPRTLEIEVVTGTGMSAIPAALMLLKVDRTRG